MRQYSHRMDAMVQQLFARAGSIVQPVGVYALGGYGRRQLCLYSDIDLLVLFAGAIGSADERFLHAFLNPLWDLGLTVGHHVREVADGRQLLDDNPEFLKSLRDENKRDESLLKDWEADLRRREEELKKREQDEDGEKS